MKLTNLDLTKPFSYLDMIGAFCIIDGIYWVHRDNVKDFADDAFIRKHCIGDSSLGWLTAADLLRNDWNNVLLDTPANHATRG